MGKKSKKKEDDRYEDITKIYKDTAATIVQSLHAVQQEAVKRNITPESDNVLYEELNGYALMCHDAAKGLREAYAPMLDENDKPRKGKVNIKDTDDVLEHMRMYTGITNASADAISTVGSGLIELMPKIGYAPEYVAQVKDEFNGMEQKMEEAKNINLKGAPNE